MNSKNILFYSIFFFGIIIMPSCDKVGNCINGTGTVSTTTLSVSDFRGIDLAIAANVTISQGATQEVKATGHPNIIDDIKTAVSNNVWTISLQDNRKKYLSRDRRTVGYTIGISGLEH